MRSMSMPQTKQFPMKADDHKRPYPLQGPYWNEDEAAELLRDLHAAFGSLETPAPERLVKRLPSQREEAAKIVEVCAGKRWSELSATELMPLVDFDFYVTEEGFPVLVAAFLHQAIVAPSGPEALRSELESRLLFAIDPYRVASAASDKHVSETHRRLRALSPAQLGVLRRFMELTHRHKTNPPWPESAGGRLWASLPVD